MTSARHIALLFPPHPTLEQPTPQELAGWDAAQVRDLSKIWIESIEGAELDPLRNGDHPEHWFDARAELEDEDVDGLTVFGGNRSGKTSFSSWLVVTALLENSGTIILCWSQTKDTSHLVQQPRIYQTLPPDLRKIRDDDKANLHYKIATGFVNDRFTLPNGSSCRFHYYSQFILNPNMIEGIEIGWKGKYGESAPFVNIGVWLDEYLIAPSLKNTLEERLSTRNAKSLLTFTPIHQYTETVEEVLEDVETIVEHQTLPDDPEQIRDMAVPYIQRKPHRSVIYFATHKNSYHPYDRSKRNMDGKLKDHVLMKLYGVPTKINSSKFPSYDRDIHEVEEMPGFSYLEHGKTVEYEPTRYHIVIPAGDRPWFQIWVAVDRDGNHWVYREWPRSQEEGGWAERRDGAWDWGDACKGECCGLGVRAYAALIEELEGDEVIFERLISTGFESVVDDMGDLEVSFAETDDEGEQVGFQRLHSLLEPLKGEPGLRILQSCRNVTGALTGYDVERGKTMTAHPWRAPIDALRLMAQCELDHPETGETNSPAAGGY